jgi:RNA polymerase sigma-70 factor (ECF subfamily)
MAEHPGNPQDEFAREFIANQGRVFAYIATLLPDRDDAEDVLQRTSLIMWQKWEHYDRRRGFVPWARGIALNEVRNFLRRSERKNVHLSESVVSLLAAEMDDDQEDHALRTEALAHCIERLERRQRDLLEQRYLGSISIQAVADALGATSASVYQRLYRIRKALVECIDRRLTAGSH